MHPTAMSNGKLFFDTYSRFFPQQTTVRVIEIGSQDVNGSLREVCPSNFEYIGVDFQSAKGVDIVLDDPYCFPIQDEFADIVISSSCFEHSEMFWLVFLEVMRILKPGGLFYLNVPSAGGFHRYPVDCWRFYPDSGLALIKWAKRNKINAAMLESYIQKSGNWQDCVSVFLKDEKLISQFPGRILETKKDFENGQLFSYNHVLNFSAISQNEKKLQVISNIANEHILIN